MTTAPILPFAPDAFISDTMHLTAEETGAYIMLLLCQWRNNGQPLKYDTTRLARMCRVTPKRFPKIWAQISEFFQHENGVIWQQRLLSDYQKVLQKILTNRQNGSKGGTAKSLKDNDRPLANARQTLGPDCSERGSIPDTDTDTDIKEESKIEGAEKSASKKPKRKNNVRTIKTEFKTIEGLPAEYLEYAEQAGFAKDWIEIEFRKFYRYFDQKGYRRPGWLASWENWIDNATQRMSDNNSNQNGRSKPSQSSLLDVATELINSRRDAR